jgi:membrane-associated phospholipid phosphatase
MTSKEKRFWKGAGIVTAEMLGAMTIFTCALAGLVFWIRPAMRRHKNIDLKIFDLVKSHTNDRNTKVMSAITVLAKHQFLIPANLSLVYYFLFIRKHTWFSIRVAAIALSSLGLMFFFKYLFKRKRPQPPLLRPAKGLSFPSGHAIMSVTFYGLLIYIISQTQKNKPVKWSLIISLIVLIQLIGFSRIYLRVHYASDVAAGYIIGLLWLLISLDLLKRIEDYNKQHSMLPVHPALIA